MNKSQLALPTLKVQIRKEVNGVEMGVLNDGSTYFSQRGLSKLCGIANSSLSEASTDWASGKKASRLSKWLTEQGFARDSLYTAIEVAGSNTYAYQEDVSGFILEYYAFEAASPSDAAITNYRLLTRAGLRAFVYHALGFDPTNLIPAAWRQFHDRMLMASEPAGYFSVFKESAALVLAAIRAGLKADEHTVPDISIGQAWATHWKTNGLSARYGEAGRHDHNYPDYFPQAKSNPQEIRVYPVQALGEFRIWMQKTYLPERFPAYLEKKIAQGALPPSAAELLLEEVKPVEPKKLPG